MKIKLLLLILFFSSLIASKNDIEPENYAVLSHKEQIEFKKLLKTKSLNSASQIYKFCFSRNNTGACQIKEKARNNINKNIELLKTQIPKNIIKYSYETNPNCPESEYIRRQIEINSVHLLGGTMCRCCVPVSILKQETYYILTGNELKEDNELSKKEYDEFQEWALFETKKLEDVLKNIPN